LHADDRAALTELGLRLRVTGRAEPPLPTPLTSLVGRDGETAEVTRLVADHRLVTLVGAGGVGKPAWRCTWPPSWSSGFRRAHGWPT
jgi:hypothetical protein